MGTRDPAPTTKSAPVEVPLTMPPAPAGRLAILTGFAAAAAAIPIPVVPDRFVARVRGALVHDVAARFGLSLAPEARALLAGSNEPPGRALARRAAALIGRRVLGRAGPLAVLGSAMSAFEVYALGHLLERYLREVRPSGAVRVSADEARRMRDVVDRATARALMPTLSPAPEGRDAPIEDLRDGLTRWVDSVLLTGASLPGYLQRRLDQAFDEVLSERSD